MLHGSCIGFRDRVLSLFLPPLHSLPSTSLSDPAVNVEFLPTDTEIEKDRSCFTAYGSILTRLGKLAVAGFVAQLTQIGPTRDRFHFSDRYPKRLTIYLH